MSWRRWRPRCRWRRPGRPTQALAWDSQTVETWLQARVSSERVRTWLREIIRGTLAAEARDASLLHALFYIRSAGGMALLIGTGGGAQERRFHQGAQTVSIRLAEALGDRVVLGAPAEVVRQEAGGVVVEAGGRALAGGRAILAVPPAVAGRIGYRPALPGWRNQLTQRAPMGSVIKVHALYDEPFWRHEGLSGFAISDSGPVSVVYDDTPEAGSPGVLVAFMEGEHARSWARRGPADRRAGVLARLADFFGERAGRPRELLERSWAEEEYSGGCYGGYFPPGVWTSVGQALARAHRSPPLGRDRDRHRLDRLHGGRRAERRAGRRRGPRRRVGLLAEVVARPGRPGRAVAGDPHPGGGVCEACEDHRPPPLQGRSPAAWYRVRQRSPCPATAPLVSSSTSRRPPLDGEAVDGDAGAVMARLIYASNMSLDGCTEDEHGAVDWAPPDDDVFAFITALMRSAGTYLYGRRMYETMAVWETDSALAAQSDLTADFANAWQAADKVVYSSTLVATSTANTRLERHFDPKAVHDLKAAAAYGSPRGWPEPRSTGSRGRAGRRAPTVRLASRPRRAQARTADRHARRARAPRRTPIRQRCRTPPLPRSVTRREMVACQASAATGNVRPGAGQESRRRSRTS